MSDADRPNRGLRIGKLISKNNGGPGAFIRAGADVSIEDAEFSGNTGGGLIVGSDVVCQLARLGLPANVPPAEVVELLLALHATTEESTEARGAIIRGSKAWEWLGKLADVGSIMNMFMQVATSPRLHEVVRRLVP